MKNNGKILRFEIDESLPSKLASMEGDYSRIFFYLLSKTTNQLEIAGTSSRITFYKIGKELGIHRFKVQLLLNRMQDKGILKILNRSPLVVQLICCNPSTEYTDIKDLLRAALKRSKEGNKSLITRKNEFFKDFKQEIQEIVIEPLYETPSSVENKYQKKAETPKQKLTFGVPHSTMAIKRPKSLGRVDSKKYLAQKILEIATNCTKKNANGVNIEALTHFNRLNADGELVFKSDLTKIFQPLVIKKHFKEPDFSLPNMYYTDGLPHKIYHIERVIEAIRINGDKLRMDEDLNPIIANRINEELHKISENQRRK
ncbi:hypothetical protein [Delftia acidovorans]|uniref:hypothetical protein n=1 Tax=Delftia acidovorans TaxID=80866 RepID=UPI00242ACE77|nr:hypothetical protein [Delftia acidovorans]